MFDIMKTSKDKTSVKTNTSKHRPKKEIEWIARKVCKGVLNKYLLNCTHYYCFWPHSFFDGSVELMRFKHNSHICCAIQLPTRYY